MAIKKDKANHRRIVRQHAAAKNAFEDKNTFSIMDNQNIFKRIKSLKNSTPGQVPFLNVGNEIYEGKNVNIGFFKSISQLKSRTTVLVWNETVNNYSEYHMNILKICQHKISL